jgi:hypothetical protein
VAPQVADAAAVATRFMETWNNVGELLEQATPEEQRTIRQHHIEVVEIHFDDDAGKMDSCALSLFLAVRSLDDTAQKSGNKTPNGGADGGSVLTEKAVLCQDESEAPRQGLEPWTKRLTAACSTN